jgi:hypothetical protein
MLLNRKISQDYLSESHYASLIQLHTVGFRFLLHPVKSPKITLVGAITLA